MCGIFSVFFMRSRAVIKVVLQAASALENRDGEQRALRNYFRFIKTKIPEISVGSKMERSVSVCSERNFRDQLFVGLDWSNRKLPFHFDKPVNFPLFFNRFSLYQGLGKGIEKDKSHSAVGWPGVIGKCCAIILQLFQLVSDRSVWHNGEHPTMVAKLLIGTTFADSCSKWDALNAEWKFQQGCARFISTTFSRKTG